MSELPGDGNLPAPVDPVGGPTAGAIDRSRVRSFIGLSVGLVGPRANAAVSTVLLTLYVQQRASTALAVTFALTANRLFSWLTYPATGRLSDRTRSRVGRRIPYMGISLMVLGAATWMFTVVHGYWPLVAMIVVAGQAAAVFFLTNAAVVPEVFGRSRWLKALVLTTVLGTIASLVVKGTAITHWKQSDPSTWNLPFQVAAVIMVAVGLVVLILVREAPEAKVGAAADRGERARPARDELRDILAGPNAKVLVTGSLLFIAGLGSTAYVAILFFQRVLHAGASAQTVAGLATGLPVFFIGIGLGIPLSRFLSPRQLAIGAPLVGAVLAGVQYFDTHLWQAVVLAYIGAPFIGAYLIVLAPMLLQLLPRSGGLGERLGILLSPFNLCSVAVAYVAAAVVDATGNYRLIWLFPAATGLAHGIVNCWLKIPARQKSGSDMVQRLWEWSIVQAESMSETGLVTGLLAAPLLGVVTSEDADSAVVVDLARNILGNPYEDDEPEPAEPDEPDGAGTQPEAEGSDEERSRPGTTGVTQVGGGPAAGDRGGDQKSADGAPGRPVRTGDEGGEGSGDPEEPDGSGAAGGGGPTGVAEAGAAAPPSGPSTAGVPAGGVASDGSSEGTDAGTGPAGTTGPAGATGATGATGAAGTTGADAGE